MVFNSDGSFSSGEGANHFTGIWQISGKILTMTLTNAVGPHLNGKAGDTVQFKIIHADPHVLTFAMGGQTISFSR